MSDSHLSEIADASLSIERRRQAFSSLAAARKDSRAVAQSDELSRYLRDLLSIAADSGRAERLEAIAELIRIRQTLKLRAGEIDRALPAVLTAELSTLGALAEAKDREYVAMALAAGGGAWVASYCARSAMEEETAERAREELLLRLFGAVGLVEGVVAMAANTDRVSFASDNAADSAARRVARILAAIVSAGVALELRPTEGFAEKVGELVRAVFGRSGLPGAGEPRHQVLVQLVRLVSWIARSRATLAVLPETYGPLRVFQRSYGSLGWDEKARAVLSPVADDIEDALVLQGRQGIPAAGLIDHLRAVIGNAVAARDRLARLAEAHPELPEMIRHWFRRGELRTAESSNDAFDAGALAALDLRIADTLLALRGTRLSADHEATLTRTLAAEATHDPAFGEAVLRAREAWDAVGALVQEMGALRELTIRGEEGALAEFDPKYFEASGPGADRMRVTRAAVVRRGPNGTDGECVRRGTMT